MTSLLSRSGSPASHWQQAGRRSTQLDGSEKQTVFATVDVGRDMHVGFGTFFNHLQKFFLNFKINNRIKTYSINGT